MTTRIAPRPGRGYAYVQASDHNRGGWTNDLTALLNEAERLCPEGWDLSLHTGELLPDDPRWTAGWCPHRGPGDDSVWAKGDTAALALAALIERAGRLPR